MTNDTNYKVCSMCGNLVDENYIFNIKDNELCKSCVEKKLVQKQNFSPLATFICSLIPGVAHIYLGKKEKGLFLLNLFFISNIFVGSIILIIFGLELDYYFISEIIVLLSPIIIIPLDIMLYFYSIANANFSRKYIENDTYIDDFVDKLAYKFSRLKRKKYLQEKVIDKRLQ